LELAKVPRQERVMSQQASNTRSTRSGKSTYQIFDDAKNSASRTSVKASKSKEKLKSPKGKHMESTSQQAVAAASSQQPHHSKGKNNSLPSSPDTTPTPSSQTLEQDQIHFTINSPQHSNTCESSIDGSPVKLTTPSERSTHSNNPKIIIDSGDEDEDQMNLRVLNQLNQKANKANDSDNLNAASSIHNGNQSLLTQHNLSKNSQKVEVSQEQQNAAQNTHRDHGWSASEGAIQTSIPLNKVQKEASFYKDITQDLLNKVEQRHAPEPETLQDEVDIRSIESQDILRCTVTPFTLEEELPNFDHGSPAHGYFTILRKILDKSVRATLHQKHLSISYQMRQIPQGMKIMKNLTTIQPTPKLELQHMQILARAERELMQITLKHYEQAIPKLNRDFQEYFDETADLEPVDRRLIVLRLLHYKNEIIQKKAEEHERKLYRPGNRKFNDNVGYQGRQPPQQFQPQQQVNRPRSPREPQMRYNNARNQQAHRTQPQPQLQRQPQLQQQPQQQQQQQGQQQWQHNQVPVDEYNQPSTSNQQNAPQWQTQPQQNMQWAPETRQAWQQQPRQQRPPRNPRARNNRF
jgi:hypothetical protein